MRVPAEDRDASSPSILYSPTSSQPRLFDHGSAQPCTRIGSTTAIFAILKKVLLDPVPFPLPGQLVAVWAQPDPMVSIPTMQDYLRRSTSFAGLAAYREWSPAQKATVAPPARRASLQDPAQALRRE